MKKHNCEECKLRAKHDKAPKSFIGRFWRWHINFCPGWKSYMFDLNQTENEKIKTQYNLK